MQIVTTGRKRLTVEICSKDMDTPAQKKIILRLRKMRLGQ